MPFKKQKTKLLLVKNKDNINISNLNNETEEAFLSPLV